jgi:superfamily II DNA/RNA helicase
MLDMGFADAIKKIIDTIGKHSDGQQRFQRVLLSATPTTGTNAAFHFDLNRSNSFDMFLVKH